LKSNAKAQISQVFTYIIIILVVGLIVVFGVRGIIKIMNANCEHQDVLFNKTLMSFIDEYSDRGMVQEESIKAPCDAEEICFADSEYCPRASSTLTLDAIPASENLIRDAVGSCTANVFVKGKFTIPIGFSKKISVNKGIPADSFQCISVKGGSVKLVFSGLGRQTQIESGW